MTTGSRHMNFNGCKSDSVVRLTVIATADAEQAKACKLMHGSARQQLVDSAFSRAGQLSLA